MDDHDVFVDTTMTNLRAQDSMSIYREGILRVVCDALPKQEVERIAHLSERDPGQAEQILRVAANDIMRDDVGRDDQQAQPREISDGAEDSLPTAIDQLLHVLGEWDEGSRYYDVTDLTDAARALDAAIDTLRAGQTVQRDQVVQALKDARSVSMKVAMFAKRVIYLYAQGQGSFDEAARQALSKIDNVKKANQALDAIRKAMASLRTAQDQLGDVECTRETRYEFEEGGNEDLF